MTGAEELWGHPLKGPLSRDKGSVTENLIKYFPFLSLTVMHDTFSAPVISFVTGYRHSPFGLFRTRHLYES
jgi:hypothetical protein